MQYAVILITVFISLLLVTYLHFYIAVKNKFSQNIQYTQLTIMLNL